MNNGDKFEDFPNDPLFSELRNFAAEPVSASDEALIPLLEKYRASKPKIRRPFVKAIAIPAIVIGFGIPSLAYAGVLPKTLSHQIETAVRSVRHAVGKPVVAIAHNIASLTSDNQAKNVTSPSSSPSESSGASSPPVATPSQSSGASSTPAPTLTTKNEEDHSSGQDSQSGGSNESNVASSKSPLPLPIADPRPTHSEDKSHQESSATPRTTSPHGESSRTPSLNPTGENQDSGEGVSVAKSPLPTISSTRSSTHDKEQESKRTPRPTPSGSGIPSIPTLSTDGGAGSETDD